MEEFDDDDFSDLYADVEVQASSAISALHRSTELPQRSDRIAANAPAEEEKGGGGGGDSRNLPVENGDRCESRSRSTSWSEGECESESEDGLASNGDGDDGVERKVGESYERKRCEEISGKEKSVNGGDYSSQSQRKILQYNSSNSKKKRVQESAQQMHRTCGKGDAEDRNLDFSRNSDDNQPHYRQKHGGLKIASERHTEASHPVPVDLDTRGSVQISDSVEDSPCEVSECDSDGISETSNDTNRRKASCIANKVSSAREQEPEPFKSSRSQRDRGYSSSPSRAAPGSRYSEEIPKRLKYSSSSFRSQSREPIAQKNRSSGYSESRGVRRGTGDGGHHERWRDSTQEHSNQPKKSHHMPHEDSYATNGKHLYNRHVNHGKQRAVVDLKYNERDIPYCSHSERMLAYSGRGLPGHHLGPAFLKDQYWDNPSSRYKAGPPDVHYISERQNFLDKRISQLEYNRFHNQRRHHFPDGSEGFRNLQYSSAVDQRGIQLMYKGEGEHLRRRTRQDCVSPLHDYDDRFVDGKYRRTHPNSGGDRDYLDCRYDRNVPHDRREVESSSRGNRRRHIPLNSSENPCYIKNDVNARRIIKHQPFPFYSFEEPYASSRGEFVGAAGPKAGVAQRNMRCSWNEMRVECDQYGTEVATFGPRESLRYRSPENFHVKRRDHQPSSYTNYIKDNRCQDHFVRRKRNQHSEVFLPKEDVYKSRQQDNIVFGSEEPSHNVRRILKNDDRPASCRIAELSEKEMGRRNSNLVGEEDNSNHFDGCHYSTKLNSHARMHPSHQDSVDRLVVVGRKSTLQSSIRTTTEAGEATYYGRCDLGDNNEPDISQDTGESKPEKTVPINERVVDASLSDINQQSKFSKNHQNEPLDIEEGQIITEEIQNEDASGHPETTSNDNGVVEKLGDEKLREILMKMERRRERFKEPITSSRDGEKTSSPLPDLNVETAEARLGRPARKRRWLGN